MFHDLTGKRIPRGRCVREETYTALVGPPDPALLQVSAGTGAWVDTVASLGHYRVTGTGALALRTVRPVKMDWPGQEWISFTVQGVHFTMTSGVTAGIGLKADNGAAGVAIFDSAAAGRCVLRLLGAGVPDIPIRYLWTGAELGRRRNLTIAIGTADRSVWLMHDDQVVHHGTYPQLRLGDLRGVLDATTTAPREMRILGASLLVETN